jgi:hypothetical protein
MKAVNWICPRCLNRFSHPNWDAGSPCPECHSSDLDHANQTGPCGQMSCPPSKEPVAKNGLTGPRFVIGLRPDITWHGTKFY